MGVDLARYPKVCALDRHELETRASGQSAEARRPCRSCHPDQAVSRRPRCLGASSRRTGEVGHALHDLARHNAWATAQVLECCRGVDESTLNATVPGTYGTISATLRHLLRAEASYLYRLTGAWPAHPWPGEEAVGLDVLAGRAATLAAVWERFLAGELDTERLGEARGDAVAWGATEHLLTARLSGSRVRLRQADHRPAGHMSA